MISKDYLEQHREEHEANSAKIQEKLKDSRRKFSEDLKTEDYSVVERSLKTWINCLIEDAQNNKKYYEIEREALPVFQRLFKSKKSIDSEDKDIKHLSKLRDLIDLKEFYKHSDDVILTFEKIGVLASALSDETYNKILNLKQNYTKKRYGEKRLLFQLEETLKKIDGFFHPDDASVTSFLRKSFSNIEPDTTKFEEEIKQKKKGDFVFLASKLYRDRGSELQGTANFDKFNNLCDKYDQLSESIFSIRIIIEKMNEIKHLSENDSYLVSVQNQIDAIIAELVHCLNELEKEQMSVASELDTFLEQHLKSEENPSVAEHTNDNKRSNAQKQNDMSHDSYRYQPGLLKSESSEEYIERLMQINPESVPDYPKKLNQDVIDKILHNLSIIIHEYVENSPEFANWSSVEKAKKERELFSNLVDCAVIDFILQNETILSESSGRKRS